MVKNTTTINLSSRIKTYLEEMKRIDIEKAKLEGNAREAFTLEYIDITSYVSIMIARKAEELGIIKKLEVKK